MPKRNFLYFFLTILSILIIWELTVRVFNVNEIIFPEPVAVLKAIFYSNTLFGDISASMIRLFLGVLLGTLAGILFGLLTGHFFILNDTAGQILNFIRFVPPLALIPLFILWLGIGEMPKIILISLACFYSVWISTHEGIQNIESRYLTTARSLCVSKRSFFAYIALPGSMNFILNGIRIGIGLAFSVLIAAEMLGAYSGLGYRISFVQSTFRVDIMIGYIILTGILGLLIDRLFIYLCKITVPWKDDS